ncbi:MAG: hypothetical protein VKJ09_03485, partial [Leptolyngbya sp.]|nr:hypothetical protein [Leptolyngbya sp.]
WRKAVYGAAWMCGMAAVVLIWGSWLLFSPSYMAITLAPTFPLALLLVVALAGVTLGLTSIGALIDRGYGRSQRFRLLVGTAWGGLALAFCGGILLDTTWKVMP